jgi:hypothetical protein
MNRKSIASSAVLAMLALGIFLFTGCGNMKAPLAPGGAPTVQQAPKGALVTGDAQDMIALSPKWIRPTARSLKSTSFERVEAPFTVAAGGALTITMPTDSTTGVRLESATFTAAAGSLDHDIQLVMKGAYGASLTDVGVMFGPSGTAFNPMATLVMVVVGPVSDEEIATLTAYHIHGTSAESIPFQAQRIDANKVIFTVGVPGFSSYSLGDDNFPPEAGP